MFSIIYYCFYLLLVETLLSTRMLSVGQNVTDSRVVTINQGPVRGYKSQYGIYEFNGIPYATTPTGEDKFKAPLAPPVWSEIYAANVTNIICPQSVISETRVQFLVEQNEQCLLANVFVPDTEATDLPVVVSVHGGGFQIGSSQEQIPKVMVREDNFISVTFNYRLGIHGFLCLGTEDIPGNAGMKDQLAALRWVKENIASFGGNPKDITLAGWSAGAVAVELLLLSETTRDQDLFHKVVLESASVLGSYSVQQDPTNVAKTFARDYLQFETDDVLTLNNFYKNKTIQELLISFDNQKDSTYFFVPCIERDTGSNNIEIFLKDAPIDILKKGSFPKMPILTGLVTMDGTIRLSVFDLWKDEMNMNFEDFLPGYFTFENATQKMEIGEKVKSFYFGAEAVSIETLQNYVDYWTDVTFTYLILWSARLQVEAGNSDVYLYTFSYVDEMLASQNPYNFSGGAHCLQTHLLNDLTDMSTYSEEYRNVINLLRMLWDTFYKTGKPTTRSVWWPPSSADGSPHLDIDAPTLLKGAIFEERVKFWDEIFEQHYFKPVPPSAP